MRPKLFYIAFHSIRNKFRHKGKPTKSIVLHCLPLPPVLLLIIQIFFVSVCVCAAAVIWLQLQHPTKVKVVVMTDARRR